METVDDINQNNSDKVKKISLEYLRKYLGNKAANMRIDENGIHF
jgi:hypothetical protein